MLAHRCEEMWQQAKPKSTGQGLQARAETGEKGQQDRSFSRDKMSRTKEISSAYCVFSIWLKRIANDEGCSFVLDPLALQNHYAFACCCTALCPRFFAIAFALLFTLLIIKFCIVHGFMWKPDFSTSLWCSAIPKGQWALGIVSVFFVKILQRAGLNPWLSERLLSFQ